jgi:S1-C subfamily serine protease
MSKFVHSLKFAVPAVLVAVAALAAVPAVAVARQGRPVLVPRGRPYLGVSVASIRGGVLVTGVVPGSPAWRAGLESGDVIVSVDGNPVGFVGGCHFGLGPALRRAGTWAELEIRDCRTGCVLSRTIRIR